MAYFQRAAPLVIEVFANEAAVAVMRRRFRTQEARAVEHLRLESILDVAFRHQPQKALFVGAQSPFSFLYALSMGSVGASKGWCTYSMLPIFFRK